MLKIDLGHHILKPDERAHGMLRDILKSHNCSIRTTNAGEHMVLAEGSSTSHSHSGPMGHIPSFKVKHPTSTFEVPFFHTVSLSAMEQKTVEVHVSNKTGRRVAFSVQDFVQRC